GQHGISRVGASQRLRQNITDTHRLHHGTNRATCNHTCTWSSRLQHNLRGTIARLHHKRNSSSGQGHLDQVLLGVLHSLTNSLCILGSLAEAKSHVAIVITHNYKRPNAEAPATLDHLGNAANLHYRL